jgi:predicted aconitase with swiveling domain
MGVTLPGRPVVAGTATGRLLYSSEPLSFWGGYDAESGEIIDRRHPLTGILAAGHVLAIPETRGSSTTTAILLESVRRGTAPAALVTEGADRFLALAAIAAEELYGRTLPVVALEPADFRRLAEVRGTVTLHPDGRLLEG